MVTVQDLLNKNKGEEEDNYVLLLHHALMSKYGWIPLEEFKKLPIPTVINLIDRINEEIERHNREYEKAKRKNG